jgi:hypothetical protein
LEAAITLFNQPVEATSDHNAGQKSKILLIKILDIVESTLERATSLFKITAMCNSEWQADPLELPKELCVPVSLIGLRLILYSWINTTNEI